MLTNEEAAQKFQFFKIAQDGVLEIFADHHSLSSIRKCEAFFIESLVNSVGFRTRAWSLEFGAWLHYALEYYYQNQMNGINIDVKTFVQFGIKAWDKLDMDYFSTNNNPNCKIVGGKLGASVLLAEYYMMHIATERLRTVGVEVGFGYAKEVPILTDSSLYSYAPFRLYYTGRIDRLVDDGQVISPFDHKSTKQFSNQETTNFKPHEGMQGYVYATAAILNSLYPDLASQGRLCNSIIINHISLKPCTNPYDRFKRSHLFYTPLQMEEWRLRQIGTATKLYELLVLERPADWATDYCNSMYHQPCIYKALHEQDESMRETVLKQAYVNIDKWNPYNNEAKEEQKFIDEVAKEV